MTTKKKSKSNKESLMGNKVWGGRILNLGRLVLGSLLLGSLLVAPACGKKGPPRLPERPFTAEVMDLKAERKVPWAPLQSRFK